MATARSIGDKKRGQTTNRNLEAHLVMIEPTEITVSQTGASSTDVTFTNADALSKFNSAASKGALNVPDSAGLSALTLQRG